MHGFTYSHHAVGAAVGVAVIDCLERDDLVEASRVKGERLKSMFIEELGQHPNVGDIRGRGLLLAVELVADREAKRPFPLADRLAERFSAACKERGLLVYPSTGAALRSDGDIINFGPPFIVTDEEMELLVSISLAALEEVTP